MKLKNILILIGLILIILVYGCTSDTEYTPPTKIDSALNDVETKAETPAITPSEPKTQTEPPKAQIFNTGDTATDNQLKVTVNDVRFISTINEKGSEFLVAIAPSGKEYGIVDITIENILPDKTQSVSTLLGMTVVDQDGYNYDLDFEGFTYLDKGFKDGEILPNMKKRGQIAFLVPKDATDLKFIYKFDVFVGTSAVFDIKWKKSIMKNY